MLKVDVDKCLKVAQDLLVDGDARELVPVGVDRDRRRRYLLLGRRCVHNLKRNFYF
jgi:hypothetical protein